MSIKVMTAVFDRYPNGGGEMLLALALADHASDDGTRVFPSVQALSEKTRQSERTVQYQLRRMEEMGWLILVGAGNGGRSMSREYRISTDWIKGAEIAPFKKGATDDVKGANDGIKGCKPEHERVQPIAPANNHHESSINRQLTIKGKKTAQAPSSFFELPDWINKSHWDAWHSIPKRKNATPEQKQLAVDKLKAWKEQGIDHAAALENAAVGGWQGLFKPDDKRPPAVITGGRPPQAESFAERDARNGREAWERMTGRVWPADELPSAKPAGAMFIDVDATEIKRLPQ